MLLESLTSITTKYKVPPLVRDKIANKLMSLRPSDVLTKGLLARDASLDMEFAQNLLMDLVNEGFLKVIILVECMNEDYPHPHLFNSLDEYYQIPKNEPCDECGSPLDCLNARIGFRRGDEEWK